uniref:Putative secreted protein n=1 Tax=Anopheles darlingi TaxID=43151 RepID=A0A2M4DFI5_ANODA
MLLAFWLFGLPQHCQHFRSPDAPRLMSVCVCVRGRCYCNGVRCLLPTTASDSLCIARASFARSSTRGIHRAYHWPRAERGRERRERAVPQTGVVILEAFEASATACVIISLQS